MCPDRKVKWFKDHGRTAAQIKEIKKMVTKRWEESYQGAEEEVLVMCRGMGNPRGFLLRV
jgi:hypothetical protein